MFLVLAGVLVALTPLAYASPPDPSWIRGLYDDGDFDDINMLITSGSGVVDPFPLDVCSVPRVTALLHRADLGPAPSEVPTSVHARAPPAA